jgi:hypothetical protein
VRPGLAVDGRAGRHVADAEFGGELPVRQAVCPACPQFPYLSAGQLGPWVTLADGAVMVAVATAAPWLESGPDVIARWVGRRPVLGGFTAVSAGVAAGRSPGFRNAAVPHGVGRVGCLPGGPGELVSARAGATAPVAPDHGEFSAHRAAPLLVFGRATGAPARLGIACRKRADARGGFFAAVASAESCPVAPPVRGGLWHFPDDGEPAVFVARIDDVPHDPDCNRQNRHSGGTAPAKEMRHTR